MSTPAIPSFIKVSSGARVAEPEEVTINRTISQQPIEQQRVSAASYTFSSVANQRGKTAAEYSRKVSTSDAGTTGKVMTADQYIQSEAAASAVRMVERESALSARVAAPPSQSAFVSHQNGFSADQYIKSSSVTRSQQQRAAGQAVNWTTNTTTSEVNREYGEQRLVSRTERVDESRSHVISERVEEREILIPKRVVVEEVIERVIVIPETVRREEVVNSHHVYKERIIERSKPTIVEKIIEIPEIEIVERIEEVPVVVYDDVEVRRPVGEPEVIEQPEYVDKIVQVENIIRRDVEKPVYYEVSRPVIVDRPVTKREVKLVPTARRVPVTQTREVPVYREVKRKLPIPVAVEAEYEYRVPQLRPVYSKQTFAMFVPRFIQVPVPREMLSDELAALTEQQLKQIQAFAAGNPTLCEIETVAAEIRQSNVQKELSVATAQDAVKRAWDSGNLDLIKAQ